MLTFDEATHTYTLDGIQLPSVTEVTRFCAYDYKSDRPWLAEAAARRGTAVHEACALIDYGEEPEETPETETKTPDEFSQRLTALESSLSEIKTMLSKQTKTPPVATRTVGGKPKTDAQKTQLSNEEARKKAREAMVKFAKEK